MAPLPVNLNIPDLSVSSLELDSRSSSISPLDLPSYLSALTLPEREALTNPPAGSSRLARRYDDMSALSPLQAHSMLSARNGIKARNIDPAAGSVSPDAINMKGVQALFGLIGASFVLGCIWFFFWAKNGGFQWRKGDWDDYKSTVMRRKGPNGTTLSNATKSTRLGGGSVVGDGYSDGTMTELSSEAPIITEKKKANNKKAKASKGMNSENQKEKKIREANEASWEGGADNDVRAYRHERVAKVGGLNRYSDAEFYDTDYSQTKPSATQHTPRGQRHASNSRHASPEKRTGGRRDFSYGRSPGFNNPPQASRPARYHSPSKAARAPMPGSYDENFDTQSQNTKSYHHPIPGLSGGGKSKPVGGFRRGRRDSLDDSD